MKFVFIIGIARTGSKVYMNIITNHSDINILSEMHYLAPRWIRKDFVHNYNQDNKKPKEKKIEDLIELIYSGKLNGTFWTTEKWDVIGTPNNITAIDPDQLRKSFAESNLSYKEIFETVIKTHTVARNKKIGGAKFPVDISCVPTLMKWFPDAQYIHIIRDPRAIFQQTLVDR